MSDAFEQDDFLEDDDNKVSKSQRKRDDSALKAWGQSLVEWPKDRLDKLSLSDHLKDAILAAKKIKSHGAKRRQMQYIGRILRAEDNLALIQQEVAMLTAEDDTSAAHFHLLEQWRDRLINEGNEALTLFVDTYHPDDVTHLRQLIKQAKLEDDKGAPLGAKRALFRFIREWL